MVIITKPRKNVYTMESYLKNINEKDIRNDWWTQRDFVWSKEQINELIYTVLTGDYIPPIILGQQEDNHQIWIVDGGQRSCALQFFRYGNYKITSSLEVPTVDFTRKVRDENGEYVYDENGNIIQEVVEFDLRGKTYDDLPAELKKEFNEYQLDTVIHEGCNSKRISKLLKRYNNHTSMNTEQKALTYIENHAKRIKELTNNDFFLNYGKFTEENKAKGKIERIITDTVICSFNIDKWNRTLNVMTKWLNENANASEFDFVESILNRLSASLGEDSKYEEFFTVKNSFLWLTLFGRFMKYNLPDSEFKNFLDVFNSKFRNISINGVTFEKLDKMTGTKGKALVEQKLELLESLLKIFIGIEDKKVTKEEDSIVSFIKEVVSEDITIDDVKDYSDDLELYTLMVDNNSKLLAEENKPSLLAIIAYSYFTDIKIDDWFVKYFKDNETYITDQKENFFKMKESLCSMVAA